MLAGLADALVFRNTRVGWFFIVVDAAAFTIILLKRKVLYAVNDYQTDV